MPTKKDFSHEVESLIKGLKPTSFEISEVKTSEKNREYCTVYINWGNGIRTTSTNVFSPNTANKKREGVRRIG